MSENKKLRKKIIIGTLIILLGATAVFSYLILYNNGLVFKKTASSEIIDKLKDIQGKGGKFELTQNDIDELSKLLRPETKGNITLKGVNIEVVNDELVIKAPIRYKKVNLLFSSKGKIDFSKEKITYTAENFKIGKLTIPKKVVLSQISKTDNKTVYAEDNLIKINSSVIPFKINSLKVKNNRISGTAAKPSAKIPFEDIDTKNVQEIDKQLATVKQKIQSVNALMNNEEKAKVTQLLSTIDGVHGKSIEEKKKVINDINNTVNEFKNKASNNNKNKKELEKISTEVNKATKVTVEKEKKSRKQKETKRDSLTKAQDDLKGAYSQVKTSKEQRVILKMQSTVSKMKSNPSYDAKRDQASVKDSYSKLDATGKYRVKYALLRHMNLGNAEKLKKDSGL